MHVVDDGEDGKLKKFAAARGGLLPALRYVRRARVPRVPHGAKAGNLNHALGVTSAEFFLTLDADQLVESSVLKELVPYLLYDS